MFKNPLIALVIIIIELTFIIGFTSTAHIRRTSMEEDARITEVLGTETALLVEERADGWYKSVITDNHVYDLVWHFFIPTEEEKAKSKGLERLGEEVFELTKVRIDTLFDIIYWVFRRIALFSIWFWPLVPIFGLAFVDGFFTRRIKQTNFDFSSPFIHQWSWRACGWICFGMIVLFFLPFVISPVAAPVLIGIVGVTLGLSVSNVQKRI